MLHNVGKIPATRRTVLLHGGTKSTRDMYAIASDRPAIPLDAHVSWTFTPDHG